MKNIRRKLIVGNWKMNGSIVANAVLLKEIKVGAAKENCDVAVCAPFPYLAQCQGNGTGKRLVGIQALQEFPLCPIALRNLKIKLPHNAHAQAAFDRTHELDSQHLHQCRQYS